MRKLVLAFSLLFFLGSCNSITGLFRSIKRVIFPSSCRIEVKLDTTDLKYLEDLWDYQITVSEDTNLRELASAVEIFPKPSDPKTEFSDYVSREFSLDQWNFDPGVAYEIKIGKFYAENDCFLETPVSFKLPVMAKKPSFYLSRENIFESNLNKVLPISISNVPEFEIRSAELSIPILVNAVATLGNRYYDFESQLNWKKTVWKSGIKVNSFGNQGMDIDTYFGSKPNTKAWIAFQLGAKVIGDNNKEEFKKESIFLQSTNLGITTKLDPNTLHVWVHSLSKAEPVANTNMSLYEKGSLRGTCKTDKDGHCTLPTINDTKSLEKSVLIAEDSSGDKTFLHFNETHIDGYSDYYSENNVKGKIYFDRKLYRPGDRVEIKAVLADRKNGSLVPYASRSVNLQIRDSRGKDISNTNLSSTGQGGVYSGYTIPSDAPLGHYSVSVYVPGKSYSVTYDTFQVEEFRPVNFMVNVNLANAVNRDQNVKGAVEGKYMFGAPMGGAKVSYSVLKRKRYINFDSFPNYDFSDTWYDYEDEYSDSNSDYITGSEGVLDSKGLYSLDIPVQNLTRKFVTDGEDIEIADPFNLVVESSVFDVDGKSVTKSSSIPYNPSESYVGLKCNDRYQSLDKPFQFGAVSVNLQGKAVAGVELKAYIIYNDWTSVLSKGLGKFFFRSNQLTKKIVEVKKLVSKVEGVSFDYRAKDPGSYTILVLNKDKVFSRVDFYAYEKESYYTWDFRGDDSIELRTDKQEYKIGDKAKILIKSPLQNSRVIVTVERDSVYFKKSFLMKGNSAPLEIPIEESYLPNVDVNVVMLSGRLPVPEGLSSDDIKEFNEQDLGAPKAKTGSVTLKINLASRTAPVVIKTDKQEYQPREQVKLSIQTNPGAELTVSVADRGVLDLVGYSFQSPVQMFYQYWYNIVKTFELRSMIIKHYIYENKGDSPGGDYGEDSGGGFSAESESGARKDFRYTAYWNPVVIADSNGNADLSFVLPDNLTTFRVMVASSANGKFGASNSEFIVKKNLVLQKTVARFIRVGDSLELGGSITNNTKKKGKFKYKIESKFLSEDKGWSSIELAAGQTKEVLRTFQISESQYIKLKQSQPKEDIQLTYQISVEPETGAEFADLKKSDLSDSLVVTMPIKEFDPVTSVQFSGYTDSEHKTLISFPKKESILLNKGSLDIRMSGTALTALKSAFDFYESNPYFCMEQRTSAYLLSLSAGELLKEFQYKAPAKDSYDFTQIEKLFLDEMSEFQTSDGSFKVWKGHGRTGYPYLTAYIVSVMQMGKDKGKRSNPKAYDLAIQYLQNYVKNPTETSIHSYQTLSLIYSVLAKDKKDIHSLEKTLVDHFEELNLKSRGIFLTSYAETHKLESSDSDPVFKKLFAEYTNYIVYDKELFTLKPLKKNADESYYYSYYSSSTVLGNYLRLLLKVDSKNPRIVDLVKSIMLDRQKQYWSDSHSVGTIALALAEYRNRFESTSSDTDGQAIFGEKTLIDESFSSSSDSIYKEEITFDRLFDSKDPSGRPLLFKRTSSEGRLYFQSRLMYVPVKDTTTQKFNGLEIRKTLYRIDGRNSNGDPILKEVTNLERGSTYLVKVKILSNLDQAFGMIVDPIPSNTEIVNTSFLTEKKSDAEDTDVTNTYYGGYKEYRDDRVIFSEDYIKKGETEFNYILRPVAKGNSIMPASKTFLMYHPQFYGNTNTIRVKVE
ncbi:alpha-2-macroglobulin family protein [Leptospira kanakyensis]|uniref:alpha-2-macroglobulin family protein n=1 Tax=Leptospira kanakyensis TaxID=2484968 RepID=UPI00223E20C2|nr:MG2 domain-containing protein [Leptospira kanakyensis]MCW7468677.1 MG2 domain-containing protein [Leptospira kanakyensis]